MATVLEFPTARQPSPNAARPMPGEVIFFPGVRVERRAPEPVEPARLEDAVRN